VHRSWAAILTDPVRLGLMQGLSEIGTATTPELAERCHTSDPTVRRHLEALKAFGLVREQPGERDGLTPGRPARRFTLSPEAATKMRALFDLLTEPLVPNPEPELHSPLARETAPGPYTQQPAAVTASIPSSLR
jgi:predicted ArsR family transcriptional regulator